MCFGDGNCMIPCKNYATEQFIEKVRLVHRDVYDYSKAVYVKANQKVIITCKNHGDFQQTPNGHLGGHGCCACSRIKYRKISSIGNLLYNPV